MRETIAAEVLIVQAELSKTKHGPHLLRKLDIEGFGRNPEQWKSSQQSKATVYRDFLAAFGDADLAAIAPESSPMPFKMKRKRQEMINGQEIIQNHLNPKSLWSGNGNKRRSSSGSQAISFLSRKSFTTNNSMKAKPAMQWNKTKSSTYDLADLALKSKLSQGDLQKLFDPKTLSGEKQHGIPFLRKHDR